MAVSGPKSSGEMFWQINITPLTDIFLVLLIIFMVTTSVTIEAASHVDLPMAENTAPENKGVIVTYTAQHELFVNSKDVTERDLESALTDALNRVDSKVVIFQGDREGAARRHDPHPGNRQAGRRPADRDRGQARRARTIAASSDRRRHHRREHDRRLTRTARPEPDTNPWR